MKNSDRYINYILLRIDLIEGTEIKSQKKGCLLENSKLMQILICRQLLFLKFHLYSERRQNSKSNDTCGVTVLQKICEERQVWLLLFFKILTVHKN